MLDNISEQFSEMGCIENNDFNKVAKKILDNVNQNTAKQFEQGQVDLGNFLGIRAYKSEKDGASDPYWIMPNNKGIIFEDYTDTKM